MAMRKTALLGCLLIAFALVMQNVSAAPLDTETCGKLNNERIQLEFAGARNNMAKGPEWAKTNLSADAVKQVRRLIEVEAQLVFRCMGGGLVVLPADVDPDPAAGQDGDYKGAPAVADAPPATAKKKTDATKKAALPQAKANDKSAAKKPGEEKKAAVPADKGPDGKTAPAPSPKKSPSTQAKQAPPAAKAKTKADDAYRPPAGDPNSDPFPGGAK